MISFKAGSSKGYIVVTVSLRFSMDTPLMVLLSTATDTFKVFSPRVIVEEYTPGTYFCVLDISLFLPFPNMVINSMTNRMPKTRKIPV